MDKSIIYFPTFQVLYCTHCQGTAFQQKIKFFTATSKRFVTYITITVTNISNNIIKPNSGVIKVVQSSSYCQKETV